MRKKERLKKSRAAAETGMRRAMRVATADGVLATASENMAAPFLALFALSLGASKAEIGLVTALPALLGNILQIPAALYSERLRRRKILCIVGGLGSRFAWFPIALIPFFFLGREAIVAFVVFLSVRAALGSAIAPAWTSLMADMTPRKIRGAYFANRNVLCSVAALAASLAAGVVMRYMSGPSGYQVVFALAGTLGLAATYTFTKFPDPDLAPANLPSVREKVPTARWRGVFGAMMKERGFAAFALTSLLWNFAVTLPQPLFAVYFVNALGGTPGMWALVSGASLVSTILGQRYWGTLADRFGNRNLMVATGVFAAIIPALWVVSSRVEHAFLVNLFAGFFWAGYNLGAFNLLLDVTPDERRTTFVAGYNGLMGAAIFVGPILGGAVADAVGIGTVLTASAVLRLAGWISFSFAVDASEEQPFRWSNFLRLPGRNRRRRRVRSRSIGRRDSM